MQLFTGKAKDGFVVFAICTVTLYVARPVLEPIAIAGILAMLFTPVSRWMEKKGVHRLVAAIACVLFFVVIISSIGALFYTQLSTAGTDFSVIGQNVSKALASVQQFVSDNFGVSINSQNKLFKGQPITGGDGIKKMLTATLGSFVNFLIGTILVLVYTTLLIYYRTHFKNFVLKIVPEQEKANVKNIMAKSLKIVPRYFSGLSIIIVCLWIMYGIGFSLVGLKGALFFALLCGTLEVIPFVGNITGSSLAALTALSQGGGVNMLLGVLVTYAIIQFIQFYIISPIVFREEIDINPFFIIFILLASELIWGVPGMIIAIPVLGIAKVIFANIEPLKPYSFLIGKEPGHRNSLLEKIFRRK